MLFRKKLTGRKVAALVADGFEIVELTVPLRALRRAGAEVEIVSLRHGRIAGMNLDQPGRYVRVDKTLDEVSAADYDALLVPGGFINPDVLRQSRAAREFVRAFDAANKPIATLCHGPWVLASAGLTRGRTLTSWPGLRDDLVNAGALWRDESLVRDGNWVSSRGPQDLARFVPAVLESFANGAPLARRAVGATDALARSAPQPDAPLPFVPHALGLLPRLARIARTLGTAAATLLVGGLVVVTARRALA